MLVFVPARALAAARHVLVHLAGIAAERAEVEAVIRERVTGLDLDVEYDAPEAVREEDVLTKGAADPGDLARIWVDLAAPITLYVTDGLGERILVRRFERHDNFEVSAEELGHAVFSALSALRAGEPIGVAREQLAPPSSAPPPAVVVPRPPPQASPWRVHVGLLFEGSAYGNGPQLSSGPGGGVQLEHVRGRRVLGAHLTGQLRLPSTVDRGAAAIDFDGGALRLVAQAGVRPSKLVQVAGMLGGGFDVVDATARSTPGVRPSQATSAVPMARAGVTLTLRTSRARAYVHAGFDLVLASSRYVVERTTGAQAVLFEPWRGQPFLAVGLQTP